jgi:spore photoproduct lyase
MMKANPPFKKLLIHSLAQETNISQKAKKSLPANAVRQINGAESQSQEESFNKKELLLRASVGSAFKPCPGTDSSYICCNYWVLNQTINCPFDCSYCILQYYLNNQSLIVHTNIAEMFAEIDRRTALEPQRFFRIGTGELGDSLALDPWVETASELIDQAAQRSGILLELKTKSADIGHLLHLPHQGKTVLAWSLNPQELILQEEHKAASLDERIAAARQAQDAGYKLAFHFDPMVWYPHWQKGYAEVVNKLQEAGIAPERIVWISIGSLRFPPEMKDKALDKFPKTKLFAGEMIRGKDNKERYIKPLRLQLYQWLIQRLKEWSPRLFIYFCMEDFEIWEKCLPPAPKNSQELDYRFAESLWKQFPALMSKKPELENYLAFSTPRRGKSDLSANDVDVEKNRNEK